MNILVTGGAGFVAKKLIAKLKTLNYNVISLDKSPNEGLVLDISDSNFVDNFPYQEVDYIFHLAAQSGGYYSLKDPHTDGTWNCLGTLNMVKLAEKLKPKKFIYVSSMAVYGDGFKVNENFPIQPISYYGVSKYTGELYTKLTKEHYHIPYSIFRLFATYGSGQDLNNKHQGILSIYLDQSLNSDTISITGSKDRVRELIHVDDVIDALLLGLKSSTDNEVYNVSNPEFLTPEIIINKIGRALNKSLNINEIKGYVGDQVYINSNVDKLKHLGWSPKYDLDKGINEFINNINNE